MKVSIILPVYNVEKYITKSIQSVLNQTFTDFELLVIIDGSPDNSKKIAETFSDQRIIIYEKVNGGLSDARNYGLKRAKGEYVYFIDSDDWIEPNLLGAGIAVLEKEKAAIVLFGYFQDTENTLGEVIASKQFLPQQTNFKKSGIPLGIDPPLLAILGYAWNKLYRKSFLNDNDITFEKGTSLVEDILFNSLAYQKTDQLYLIPKAYYHYVKRPITTLIKQFHSNSFDLILKRNQYLEKFLDNWNIQNKKEILATMLIQGFRYSVSNLFSNSNNLSLKQKVTCIKTMVNNSIIRSYINYYQPILQTDRVYKTLIRNKNYRLIGLLMYLRFRHDI